MAVLGGVVFDQTLSLEKHVNSVCKAALFHLRNIAKIREYLTVDNTKILVHAFVICRLDNCNSLLVGSPKFLFNFIVGNERNSDCFSIYLIYYLFSRNTMLFLLFIAL